MVKKKKKKPRITKQILVAIFTKQTYNYVSVIS